ncbi:MAG: DegV family protein [Christensenellaceae bacterium]
MKIAISTESAADLPKELLDKYDISSLPFSVTLGDKTGFDGEITGEEIIAYVNKHKILPKTGAINEAQFAEHFSKLLKTYDAIVHFSLSSGLSSAYNNAVSVAKKIKNVYVVDSKSLSAGIGLLALYGRKLADKGFSAAEIYEKSLARVPYVQVSSELKRVDYLYLGGRCSMLAFLGANILRIRPQIVVKDGKLVAGKKYRGKFERIVERYVRDTLEEFNDPDLSTAFVAYTSASPEIIENAVNIMKERGFENVYVTRAGATIVSHTGEDCVGVYYINDGGVE